MEYIIILIVAIVIFLFIKNFTKRKLTFTVLAISFLLSIIPCSMGVIDIGDGPGDGFIIIGIYFYVIIPWLTMLMMPIITNSHTFYVLSLGFFINMAIVFGIICLETRLKSPTTAPLLFIINTAFFILCAYIIEKAQTTPMKIAAVALTLASFIVPYGFIGLYIKCV